MLLVIVLAFIADFLFLLVFLRYFDGDILIFNGVVMMLMVT